MIYFIDTKTAENILKTTQHILQEYEIEEKLSEGVMVTDNGSNVVAAFKNYSRQSCACHNINLVMSDLFEKSNFDDIKTLVEACKKLVCYFKHSQLNSKLSKTLKQQVKTRWNSIYTMISSIIEMKTEIQSLLLEKNEIYRISSIDFNILSNLLAFLEHFKNCSEQMSADLVPTLHEYILWFEKLKKICNDDPLDDGFMKNIKSKVKESLISRCEPTTLHFVAAFLNPPFKDLHFIKTEQTMNSVEVLLKDIFNRNGGETNLRISQCDNSFVCRPQFQEFLMEVDSSPVTADEIVKNEIEKYTKQKIRSNIEVLEF